MTLIQEKNHSPAFGKLRYLVIDDFENFRLSMRQMLRSFGADNVELVSSGSAAIQHCTYEPVDVVLCDYNLGEGRNGQHILEELRHRKLLKRSSLFLMVTAETSREMVMGAREYQPDAYLTKPINRSMLEKRLGALVMQRQALLPINRAIDLENHPEAITLCLEALPRQPRHKTWLMKTLADLYFQVGDYGYARKIYDEVLGQRALSWALLGKAKVLLAERHYDEASARLRELIEAHPDYTEAYDLLAEALRSDGKNTRAQAVLEEALELSPNALLRHRQLAELAAENQDIDTATQAWRNTVDLGTHSIHDSVDHHLALSRSLSDLSEGDATEEGREKAEEAMRVLARMQKRFAGASDLESKTLLIQARLYAGRGHLEKAADTLAGARAGIEDELADPDLGLDLAKTCFRLQQKGEAEALLGRLAEAYANNPEVLHQIEALLDEPVGFRQKLQARALNRQGIKAFEAGELDAAAEAFSQALAIVPSHAALNLNLAQVLMKKMAAEGRQTGLIERCRNCLKALESLPQQHRQYQRYRSLMGKLEASEND